MSRMWKSTIGGSLALIVGAGGLALSAPVAGAAGTTTLFVSLAGTGTTANSCETAADPCLDIQQAMDRASAIPGRVVVTIGDGTYGSVTVVSPHTPGDETFVTLQPDAGASVSITTTMVVTSVPTIGLTDAQTAITVSVIGLKIFGNSGSGVLAETGATLGLTGVALSTNGHDGVFVKGATVSIADATISGNDVDGALATQDASMSIANTTVRANDSKGVNAELGAHVTVTHSTISFNDDTGMVAANAAFVNVTGSTIADNSGTGILVFIGGTGVVANSTVYRNDDDGVVVGTAGSATVTGSTIADNTDSGVLVSTGATVRIGADLLVAATAGDACRVITTTGSITGAGYDVVNDDTCQLSTTATSQQTVANPLIGLLTLSTNGGPTQTQAIALTSVANDLVPAAATVDGTTFCTGDDQRGPDYPRLVNGATDCAVGAFQPAPTLVVSTTSLPGATVGMAYSGLLGASGGAGAETWAVVSGSLPAGITLSPSGVLSGTPTAGGTYSFAVRVADTETQTATATLSILVTGTGYDLVGSDGGVFVFDAPGQSGGFFGSLPSLGVTPAKPIVGMVPTATDSGYFLVGSDGGVFAFGNAPFLGSLPGLKVVPNKAIVGIVAANADKGYFLVGKDGGVYAFGTVPFLGSLPGKGKAVSNVIGISAEPSGQGYWVVQSRGSVTAFGNAASFTTGSTTSPVAAIAGTSTGQGYWLVTQKGGVYPYGDAKKAGSGTLAHLGVTPSANVIGIVPTDATAGYWLLGGDGGIFAFNAPFYGSLPGLTPPVHVTNIVGAVPN